MLFSCTEGVGVGGGSVAQEVKANVINVVSDSIGRGCDAGWGVAGMAGAFLIWLWADEYCQFMNWFEGDLLVFGVLEGVNVKVSGLRYFSHKPDCLLGWPRFSPGKTMAFDPRSMVRS
jgi:hypothetical protein